jgi:hypothetical protein
VNGFCEFQVYEGTCINKVEPTESDSRSQVMCPTHCETGQRVCVGCGGQSARECGYDEDPGLSKGVCRQALCAFCIHKSSDQGVTHGSPEQQEYIPPPTSPTQQQAIDALRADLAKSVKDTLIHAGQNQIDLDKTSELIVQNLSLHVVFQTLSGMAAHPPE